MKPKFFLSKSIATLLATGITLTSMLHALPQGEQVQAGSAAFSRAGGALDIHTSDRAIINYQSFSIGSGERVNFIQPSAMSMTLNRVTAPNPSQIFGTLQSNGKIVLANPYGIFFETGSIVNVGGLIAGAGHISDSDFLAGRINFSSLTGDVENRGSIIAINDVGLYGVHVSNEGVISSQKGSVTLAAGSSVYVGEKDGNIFVGTAADIPKAKVVSKPGVKNSGTITAPQATLVAGDMYGMAIAQSGTIISGNITISAGKGGSVDVSGRLDASNRTAGKSGGKIKIKGDAITVRDATLDASGDAGGGSVILDAGHDASTPTTVTSSGKILALGTGTGAKGGAVQLLGDNVSILAAGEVDVSGVAGGGNLTLDGGHDAKTPTTVTSSGTILALGTGTGAKGGTVQMLGDHVGLLDRAIVDVSGDAGGGTVLIGGNYQGMGPEQNAFRTHVSGDSRITADALNSGNGGKVIVWSNETTRLYGDISARGGSAAGNGGFVEVSGHNLGFHGHVDLFAPKGVNGSLLLDPAILTVIDTGGGGTLPAPVAFADGANSDVETVEVGSITGAGTTTLQAGQLRFTNAGDIAMGPGNSLTITVDNTQAGANGGTGNNTITNPGGNAFNITTSGAGVISMTAGGAIDLTGITLTSGAGGVSLNGSGITTGTITATGGTVTLTSTGTVTQTGILSGTTLDLRGAGGTFTLNTQNNAFTNLKADTNALAALTFKDDTGFAVTGINSAGAVTLESVGGTVTQTGAIAATTLTLTGAGGTFTLNTVNNAVTTLDADNAALAALSFKDDSGFAVAGINSAGAVTLESVGGTVTQTGAIAATTLTLTGAGGTFTLNTVNNAVTTLDADNAALAALSFKDDSGFAVAGINSAGAVTLESVGGTVTQTGAIAATTLTLTGAGGTFTLNTVNNAVTTLDADNAALAALSFKDDSGFAVAGINSAGAVTLESVGGTVTQTGAIAATTLTLTGAGGTFTLNTVNNAVTTLDADNAALAALSFKDDSGFAVAGINSAGAVTLESVGGTVTQTGAIAATTLTLTGAGGTFTLNTVNNAVTTLDADNAALAALSFKDDSGFAVAGINSAGAVTLETVGGTVTQTGAIAATTLTLTGAGGTFTLNTVNNAVTTLDADNAALAALSFKDDSGFAVAGINSAGAVTLESVGGTVTQTGAIAATTLTLTGAGGTFNLDNTGNDFGTVTVTTANIVTLVDTNALILGNVVATSLTAQSGATAGVGNISFAAATTIQADTQSYRAGNGPGGGAAAVVDFVTVPPTLTNTANNGAAITSFTHRQDAAIADGAAAGDIVAVARFGGAPVPLAYTIRSDEASVTITNAANVTGSSLTLNAATVINIDTALTLVSLSATAPSIVLNAAGTTAAPTVVTTGAQTYTGAVTLIFDTVLTTTGAGNVVFTSTIDTAAGPAVERALEINTQGDTLFGDVGADNIGAIRPLASLLTDAPLAAAGSRGGTTVFNIVGGQSAVTTGAQTFNDAVSLGADTALTGVNVTFASTINADAAANNRALTVNDTGTTTITGNVGTTQALADFDVTAGLTVFNAVAAQTVAVTAQGANTATLTGPVRLDQNVTFDTGGATANNLTFTSTIDADAAANNRTLTVTAGARTVTFTGNVGATQALADFDVTAGLTVFNAVAAQTVAVTAQGANTATLTGPVRLDQNVTFDTGGATANNLTFTSTIDADAAANNRTLTVTAGARTVTFTGNVGATQALADFDVTAAAIVFNAVAAQTVAVTAQGANTATLTGPVRLDQNVTFDTGGATANNLTFTSTIDADAGANNRTLTVTAGARTVTFTGNVGTTQALADFDVTAAAIVFNAVAAQTVAVTAQGANTATLTGPVRLDQNVTFDTGGATANNLTFTSTIDADAAANNRTLTVTAGARTVTFTGNVGATQALADFDVTAAAIVFNAVAAQTVAVTAQGANTATLTGPVRLDQNVTFDTGGATANNLTFTSTIDADAAANNRTLTVTAGARTVTFTGNVGATQALADFDVTAAAIVFNAVAAQTVAVTAQGANTATLTGPVRLDQNVTFDTGGATANNLTFTSTIDAEAAANNRTLTVTAGARTVTFTGNVGATQALADFDVTAAAIVFNAVAAQTVAVTAQGANTATLTGAVTLNQDLTINTSGVTANNLTFSGAGSTIDGTNNLTITSGSRDVLAQGTIGGTTPLTSLTVNSNPTDTGNIRLVNIGGAAAGVSGATVVGNVNAAAINFNGTTYNANTQTYTAAPGNTLLINAGVTTTFTSSNDAISFNTGNILLANGSNLVVNSGGGAISALAINGNSAEDVTLNANGGATNTVLVGAIGTGVANGINTVVLTGAGGVTLNGSITTDNTAGNSVTVSGPATLGATLTINTSANTGGITFNGAASVINGAQGLTLAAGPGDILLGGAVGGVTPLGAILISSASNVTASAAITAASLVQSAGTGTTTLNGPVSTSTGTGVQLTTNTIAQNSTITTTSGGVVTFTNAGQLTVNGDIFSDGAVTQNGTGATLFGGGGTRAITTTNDGVAFLTAITLAAPVTITSGAGNVTFSSTVNGPASLSASSSGVTTFTGVVGGSSPLASLTTNGGGTTVVPGAVITAGSQNIADVLVLAADTLLSSTGGGAINLLSTVSGGNRILQLSTAGSATLGASLLNLTRLIPGVAGVTTLGTAGTITAISLPTPLIFTGPVSVAGNVLIETTRGGASSQGTNSGDELRFNQSVTGDGSLNATAGGVLTFAGGTSVGALSASAPIINLNNTSTTGNLIADAKPAASTDGSDGLLNLTGGSYSASFGNVFFNPTARTLISKHATILSLAGDVAISAAGSFFMGNEQKLLVNNGALNIVANTATLGDMAAFTRMNVTAGSVQLQGRSLNGFFNANRKDGGLGFVSPTIMFSTGSMAFVSGTNQKAVFATRDAIASVPQISGVSLQIDKDIAKQFGNLDLKLDSLGLLPVVPNISFGTVQPIASGTFVVDPSQTRVVFVFEIPKLVELPQDTFLSKAIRRVLNSMGINEREATSDENITVSLRRGVFTQPIEGKAEMEDLDFEVVLNRLTKEEILYIVGSYLKLAGDDFAKLTEIAISLSEQVGKFQTANPGMLGLDGFAKWLQTQRATDKAADQLAVSLDKLSAVFVELSRVGLTKKEITLCKVQICNKLKEFMPDVPVRDVIPLVEGGGPPPPEAPRPAVTVPPPDAPPTTPPPAPAGQAPSPDSTAPGNPATGAGAPPVPNPAPTAPAPDASAPPNAQ